jgi:hypothetical protein
MQEPAFAAFIGLDWADKKHDVCLQIAGSTAFERSVLEHTPRGRHFVAWANAGRKRFDGAPVAVCVELSGRPHRSPLSSSMSSLSSSRSIPAHPRQVPSRLLPERCQGRPPLMHRSRSISSSATATSSSPWTATPRTCAPSAASSNSAATSCRIGSGSPTASPSSSRPTFPRSCRGSGTRQTAVFADFLERWPSLTALKRARPDTVVAFFHAHRVRHAATINRRDQGH